MQSIFVDTGAWYAAMVRKDRDHEAAKLFLKHNTSSLICAQEIMPAVRTSRPGKTVGQDAPFQITAEFP